MELELVYNEETQEWEQKKEPFITIEVETEEDFEFIGNAIAFYKKRMDEQVKPQTNADRIRAMSDEELAKEFADCAIGLYCDTRKKGLPELPESVKQEVLDSLLKWLKQPAKGE